MKGGPGAAIATAASTWGTFYPWSTMTDYYFEKPIEGILITSNVGKTSAGRDI